MAKTAATAAAAVAAMFAPAGAAHAVEQAVVDFSVTAAPMTHRASGFLHSIDGTGPSDALIAAVKPQMFRDRPDGGNGGGIFAQHDRLKALGVKHFQVVISDGFNGDYAGPYPGDDGTYLAWENYVTNLVVRAKTANVTLEYDVWNEPDIGYFWRRDAATFRETWKRAVNRIRLLDPGATIVGPSYASYGDGLKSFLLNAKADNVLPDVLAWHEFGSSFTARVADARAFMTANGIAIDRISLNEIVGTSTFDGAPQWQNAGPLPRYFLNIERGDIESAAHACWAEPGGGDNCENASLNGLLTSDTKQPRSTYWVYERYARMSGHVAQFTQGVVRNDAGVATFDGLATKDDGAAHVLFGRTRSTDGSAVEVKLTNLDDVPNLVRGGAVRVTGETIVNTKTAASAGPVVTHDRIVRVNGDALLVPVRHFGNSDAYFLKLEAVPTWSRDGDGAWNDGSAWDGGAANGIGKAARLGPTATARPTVSVNTPQTVGLLTLDHPLGYRIAGSSTLTLDNGPATAVIEAVAGVNELDVALRVGPGAAPPELVVGDGATLKIGGGNRLAVGPITIGATGQLDLRDSTLITSTAAGVASGGVYSGVQGEVQRAYNFGAWDGPGGMLTSMPNAGPTIGTTTIGVARAAEILFIGETDSGVFAGQTVTGTSTIAMYTYAGDVNFDGLVDAADYGVIDNWIQFPGTDGYMNGDFNYDGIIDAADYGIIDNTIQLQGDPMPVSAEPSTLPDITSVPEAASTTALALAAGLLSARRRHRGRRG